MTTDNYLKALYSLSNTYCNICASIVHNSLSINYISNHFLYYLSEINVTKHLLFLGGMKMCVKSHLFIAKSYELNVYNRFLTCRK